MITKRQTIPPWESASFELADAIALKALAEGNAEAEQQKRALNWIVHAAARLNRPSFHPDSERASCLAEGRRMVGLQIMRLVTSTTETLKTELRGNGGADG